LGHRITTVLLVDDHTLVRRAFRRMLEDASDILVVGEANDGPSAIVAAQRLRPDVVVMDFALPGMMGGEATQEVIDAVPTTTVLVVSMHSESSYVRAALDAGASGYLLKSAVELELAEAVRMIAQGRQVLDARIARPPKISDPPTRPLTPREVEVLRLIVQGKSHEEIAQELDICANTVRVHRANMMQALAIHSCVKLTLYAVGLGLVNINGSVPCG
jgi:DNA-binding NarL/FixJ family response regulator